MKKCIVCLKEIEDNATECKYCGSYQVDLDEDYSKDYDGSLDDIMEDDLKSIKEKVDEEINNTAVHAEAPKKMTMKKGTEAKDDNLDDIFNDIDSAAPAPKKPSTDIKNNSKEKKKAPVDIKSVATKKRNNKPLIIGIIAALLLIGLIVGTVYIIKTGFFEKRAVAKTVKSYYEALNEDDGIKYEEVTCPPKMKDYMEEYIAGYKEVLGDITIDEYFKTYFLSDATVYSDVKIVDYTPYDETVVESLEKEYKDYYNLDIDIEKGYSINTEFKYKMEGEAETSGASIMRVIKVDGKWYIYN